MNESFGEVKQQQQQQKQSQFKMIASCVCVRVRGKRLNPQPSPFCTQLYVERSELVNDQNFLLDICVVDFIFTLPIKLSFGRVKKMKKLFLRLELFVYGYGGVFVCYDFLFVLVNDL